MKLRQLRALFWLRRRMFANRLKRAGWTSEVLLAVLAGTAVVAALSLFVFFFLPGLFALRDVSPLLILYAWDGLVAVFLAMWIAGTLVELQREDVLSLDKFLHLPVSPVGAFAINYLGSLFCPTLLLATPAMVGLSLGLMIGRGATMLPLAPLLAAMLLMVTAVTHQFQGWLASLMANKRRRRTIIVLLTLVFVLVFQAPSLYLNLHSRSDATRPEAPSALENNAVAEEKAEIDRALASDEITPAEYTRRLDLLRQESEVLREQLRRDSEAQDDATRLEIATMEQTAWLANLILPPGWLPLGAMAAAEGHPALALLPALGMTLLGAGSLWRSYRTTARLYTGHFDSGRRPRALTQEPPHPLTTAEGPAAPPAHARAPALKRNQAPAASTLLEQKIPWLSQEASAVAMSTLCSLARAPEVKMILLSPILMAAIAGPILMRRPPVEELRPLQGFGVMALILVFVSQLAGNQFGLDRGGFQVFLLCGVRRQDILLGKNVAIAPFALAAGLLAVVVLQVISPMPVGYFLAVPAQFVSMCLPYCLLANWLSIVGPVRLPAGKLRAARPGLIVILLQLIFAFVLYPLALAPTLLPIGAQMLLERQGWGAGIPVCLLLSLAECVAAVYVYRFVLRRQGNLLQSREQEILAIVRSKAE